LAARRIEPPDEVPLNARPFQRALEAHRVLLLDGWLFRWHGDASRHLEALREHFAPVDRIGTEVQAIVEAARGDAGILVGVHVRQGDYRHFEGGRYFYGSERYAALVSDLWVRLGSKTRFLVASNEIQDPSVFDGLPVHLQCGDPVVDLHALAACDLIVGPPSTFSMWASLYGDTPLHLWVDSRVRPSLEDFRPFIWR